jgi:hypothetical protein
LRKPELRRRWKLTHQIGSFCIAVVPSTARMNWNARLVRNEWWAK